MASRSRATSAWPGSTVKTASASGAAALDPPQGFGPPDARLARRGREDHPASRGLQHGGDDDADGLVHVAPAIFDHDHGAVVEVCDALVLLITFLAYLPGHLFT